MSKLTAVVGGVGVLAGMTACTPEPVNIQVDGSPGVMPLIEQVALAYQDTRPNLFVRFGRGLGSSARLDSLASGRIQIAVASHGVDSVELAKRGMTLHHVADVPVGFAVNASVPVTTLTEAQICDIYRGRIRNWRDVGGPDMPIAAAARPTGEVDADVLLAGIPCLRALTMAPSVSVQEMPPDMSNYVANTRGALGMMSATMVDVTDGKAKAIAIDGVAPTPENLEARKYRHLRHNYLVTRSPASAEVQAFLDFIRGPRGEQALRANQAVPRGH